MEIENESVNTKTPRPKSTTLSASKALLTPEEVQELLDIGFCRQEIDHMQERFANLEGNQANRDSEETQNILEEAALKKFGTEDVDIPAPPTLKDGKPICDCGASKTFKSPTLKMHSSWCSLRS